MLGSAIGLSFVLSRFVVNFASLDARTLGLTLFQWVALASAGVFGFLLLRGMRVGTAAPSS